MSDSWIVRLLPMCIVTVLMWSGVRVVVEAQANEPSASMHESFSATSDVRVSLQNVAGRIVVTPSGGDTVEITAVKHASDARKLTGITVTIDKDGNPSNEVRIRTTYPHEWRGGGSVDYTLRVPRRAVLRIGNVSGSIVASGFANDLTATDVSGNITVEDIDGNLKVRTVNGAIVASVPRFIEDRNVQLHTVSGPITLTIPRSAGAVVKVRALSGEFHSDFPLTVKSELIGAQVDGRIGNGGGFINIETLSGSTELKSSGR